ncbi:glycosyltransferase family 4 protein [Flagellimonas olearia]|uniref:Glycosyl transferase family 1 n=1 Tax=Flagellimonas olearia TaxID=552546 RepID=A0A444VKX6_9FLAO|nr:glycosyltransferase family 4 protein [Allomuricauda olearia]RYC51433.1 glycosyl transferase family 1 [Allomuricauda olearia]
MAKPKLIRITTVPGSLGGLLKGQLKFMNHYFEVIGISSPGDSRSLSDVSKQEGIRVIPVEMTRKITPLKDLIAVWKLYRIFMEEKPIIVHTHTPKAGTLGMIAAYMARVPHRLHTVAGLPLLEAKGNKRKILDLVEKLTYRFSTEVYPNSFGLKEIILNNKYTNEGKLKVIGKGSSNGIDTDYFDPKLFSNDDKQALRKKFNIKPDDYVFIFVGRIVSDKGINELVSAFKDLTIQYANIKLLLVGAPEKKLDPILPENEDYIKKSDFIIEVGWQTDVRPFFSISNSLIFPSYREGFPNVVMQACAMGIPSVVTNINGCNELIRDKKNGLVIPVKNIPELKSAMVNIMCENDLESSNEIRQFMIDNYSRNYVHNEILLNYRSLIKEEV